MDSNTVTVIVVLALAAVIVAGFVFFRGHKKVDAGITGPSGMGARFSASGGQTQPRGGVQQLDVAGHHVTATDKTGQGVEQRKIRATGDVTAMASPPRTEGPSKKG